MRTPVFRKSRFTLIELLVVVTVMSILASLLLPSLSAARGVGKRIKCANNEKQIGVAFMLYSSDNDSWVPSSPTGDFPVYHLNAYLRQPFVLEASAAYPTNAAVSPPSLFVCPAATNPGASPCWSGVEQPFYGVNYASSVQNAARSEGVFGGWMQCYGGVSYGRRVERIAGGSVISAEMNYVGQSGTSPCYNSAYTRLYRGCIGGSAYPYGDMRQPAWQLHGGQKANFLFIDVHVSALRYSSSFFVLNNDFIP